MSEYIIAHCVDSVSGVRYDERREEIVRCRDCKYYDTDWKSEAHPGRWLCNESWHYREPDGFCKWGERK